MSINLEKQPGYEQIINALVKKTKEGKLRWQETAQERTFLAAVKGQRTFEISQDWVDTTERIRLVIRDVDGRPFVEQVFNITGPRLDAIANEVRNLYECAKRIALDVDEKVDDTVQLLSQL
jgi:hypothetical protein